MTISYNWLLDFFPKAENDKDLQAFLYPDKLSEILTAIGLEVEEMRCEESVRGGLKGLLIGEVLSCEPHPNSDHLHVTSVDLGLEGGPVQIVCGASNVACGQKVVVAPVGATIYPVNDEPVTMKKARLRGVDSYGMICAEDEIGIGEGHDGILVLPADLKPGLSARAYFKPKSDYIYEIGLTPNRMDAMSHWGVARDVCAALSHRLGRIVPCQSPLPEDLLVVDDPQDNFSVAVEDADGCLRYSCVSLNGVKIAPSPEWLQQRLISIGLKPINNVVDITNFILNETGQPLHVYDADRIAGHEIIVTRNPASSVITTLDGKERKLNKEDLMICDSQRQPLCFAGVFGGQDSGVTEATTHILLESACFNPISIRRTSVHHDLRTDAAARFEKGTDLSATVKVLARAALLIRDLSGGKIASEVFDYYPLVQPKKEVFLTYAFLRKLSGKNYVARDIKNILTCLGFEIIKEDNDGLQLSVPYSKPDISMAADLVEEVLRIDGLDNIDIPATISVSPASDQLGVKPVLQEKLASYLVGRGFNEIITNSITCSRYYEQEVLSHSIRMLNSLTQDLDIMRPSMLETGLEVIAYNTKRKINNLHLFEFGKTYSSSAVGLYHEKEHLSLYLSGSDFEDNWKLKGRTQDFYTAKGLSEAIVRLAGFESVVFRQEQQNGRIQYFWGKDLIYSIELVAADRLKLFDIKQPVIFIDFNLAPLSAMLERRKVVYKEISRFPQVSRDLALVMNRKVTYGQVKEVIRKCKLDKLRSVRLFDIFESDKLGKDKKSMALNFLFQDESRTLTDKETEKMMYKISESLIRDLEAEIRK